MSEARRRVVVVGAGLAGLSAAGHLARSGADVVVVERTERAGGRHGGEWVEGFSVEDAMPRVLQGDRHLVAFVRQSGLADALLPLRVVQVAQIAGGGVRPIDPYTLRGRLSVPGLRPLDALRTVRLARLVRRYASRLDPEVPERAARWDDRSVADFARLYFGASTFERWIAPETTGMGQGDAAELSRVLFLLGHVERQRAHRPDGVPRGALHEAARRAAQALGVRFATTVQGVTGASDGLRVELESQAALEADAVVLATAADECARLAAPLLSPPERDFLGGVDYAPSATLSLALDRAGAGRTQLVRVPRSEGSPLESFLLEPGLGGGRAPEGAGLVTAAATRACADRAVRSDPRALEAELRDALFALWPRALRSARFTRVIVRDAAVPEFRVGAYRALERFRRVQLDRRALGRRLYFAGDHLIGPRAEHAVFSGVRAAREVALDLQLLAADAA